MQGEQSSPIALQSPSELAEYLTGSQAKSFSRLSRIELDDIRIPGGCGSQSALRKLSWIDIQTESAIVDTSPWVAERTLDSLPDLIAKGRAFTKRWRSTIESFLLSVTPSLRLRLSQKPKANGAPTLIFVAGSALRVADVVILLPVVSPKRLFTP